MYIVYILRSERDGKLYIGQTDNLQNRLKQHQFGEVKSTKHRLPVELIYIEGYRSRILALTREKKLKDFKSAYREVKKRIFHAREGGG